jgi:NADPH-dependent 2,4-dienoyl-CoA reductase/sulfur reductase-like enzyme/nitrite reductase/ring-hydroxylating ferredoxin subunit
MSNRERRIAHVDELQNGDMKQISIDDHEILLAKVDGRFHALSAHCTHYGAPLVKGALGKDRIVCPWHHASFELASGDQLEAPGLDSLACFTLQVKDDDVFIQLPDQVTPQRTVKMTQHNQDDQRCYVVLGAGAAGEYAVEALRQAGFTGRVVLVSQEKTASYDRTKCSKTFLQKKAQDEGMPLRSLSFYQQHHIELMTDHQVERIDTPNKTLLFSDGDSLAFDKLILCTGSRPRKLGMPGSDLKGVYTLRSWADSQTLREVTQQAKQAVIVGASFIAMEVVWSLRSLGLEVTVVAPDTVPFEKVLGSEIGHMLQAEHEENGVRFQLGTTVKTIDGNDRVTGVTLENHLQLPADLVVIGIGVSPATDFIDGLELAEDGGVIVDEYLKATDDVYAAGDIAQYPDWLTGKPMRIEHWRVACQQGRIAGFNAAGRSTPYRSVPYFWTAQFGVKLRYVGHASQWDEIIVDGALQAQTFIAYYVKDGRVLAAAGVNRDQEMAALQELLRRDLVPHAEQLKDPSFDVMNLLKNKGQ